MINLLGARIQDNVKELSVAEVVSTRAKERTGYSARFAPVNSNATIKDYSKNGIEWDKATIEPINLTLAEQKYFAFTVDNVDALLTDKEEIDKAAKSEAQRIKNTEDAFVLDKAVKGAGKTVKLEENIYDAIVDANVVLSSNDIPFEDRFAVISYSDIGNLNKDARFTHNYEILKNGLIQGQTVNGVPLIVTNNLPANSALVLHKEGVGFERFLDKLATVEIQDAFADGVKGLNVYDAVVLSKKHIVKIDTTAAVETK